ncbi:hypothetical protein IWX90DRAFT_270407 [Phyllosticta citrichinensis]|uniref:Methyltransferase type 11 domain-containing protein n=1 Tax=Phyllosticta citrichinensis TaxID=1130410 RepID=A0ABR1XML8_9PEZI
MASQNPQPVSSWFRRDASSSAIPQRRPSNHLPSRLGGPAASSPPVNARPLQRTPSKLTKKAHERPTLGPAGSSSSTVQQRVVPPSKSSGSAGLHRENNHGSESNHHPTKTRVPRFDAATTRTPPLAAASSLASGPSAASTHSSPRTAVLRRKPSSIGRPSLRARTVTEPSVMMHENASIAKALSSTTPDPYSDTVLGVAMPSAPPPPLSEEREQPPGSQPHDQADPAYHAHTFCTDQERPNQLLAPNRSQSTPAYALSASPSTRCSESPGHFSHASSSTSMSSHSPGMVTRVRSRTRQISPITIRPSLDRSKTEGTSSIPTAATDRRGPIARYNESATSSSSSSTVVGVEQGRRERKLPSQKDAHPGVLKKSAVGKPADIKDKTPQAPPPSVPKQSSERSGRERPIYPPPELAHLADADNKTSVSTHLPRPARPSREGTQDLSHLQRPSPVVQSNLTSLPTARHRRQISSGSASPGSFASRITSPQTSNGSKKPSISTSTTSPNLSLPDSHLSPMSTHDSNIEEKTRGLSPGNGTARFGFFSRKSPAQENVAASAVLRKEKKVVRKGPMAGTGHEGYGKYGIGRGRSISTNSLTSSFGRSPSSESITSNNAGRPPANRKDSYDDAHRKDNMSSQKDTGMDDFLRERLQPVILRGEGSAGSSIATSSEAAVSTSSLGSAPPPRPATAPRNDSNASLTAATGSQRPSVDRSRPTLLPSSMTDSIRGKSPLRALAGRHKRTVSNDSALSVDPAPQHSNTTYGPSGSKKVIIASPSTDSSPARPQKKEKDGPSKLNRKWNFFQRAHSTPKNSAPPPSMAFKQQMPFTVPSSLSNRPVAHYALDDAEEKPINVQELELMMEEVARGADDSERERSRPPSSQERKQSHGSVPLPPPPILRWPFESIDPTPLTSPTVSRYLDSDSGSHLDPSRVDLRSPSPLSFSPLAKEEPPVPRGTSSDHKSKTGDPPTLPTKSRHGPTVTPELMHTKSPLEQLQLARPSRLQQVGRIPLVVSTGDRRRNPNHSSFSRPFASDLPSPAHPPPNNILGSPFGDSRKPGTLISEDPPTSSALPRDSIIPRPLFCNGSGIGNYDEPALQRRTSGQSGSQLTEFLAFPRKYSEISHTSSSHAGYSSYALTPGPSMPPEEDEVWREYDDLIDEVMSSPDNRTPKSRGKRKRANLTKDSVSGKFMERMSRQYSDQAPASWLQDSSRPGTVFEEHQDGAEATDLPNPFVEKPKVAVVDFEDANVSPKTTRVARNPSTSVHLRRSQMLANFQPLAMLQTAGPIYNAPLEPPKDVNFTDPEGRLSLPSMRLSLESAELGLGAPKSSEATGESSEKSKLANASSLQNQADAKESTTTGLERVEESPKPIASGTRYRDSRLMEASEYQNDGVISMANLRVGALKTSKWLSFGRVLFSPAHLDLEESNDERVLILDGLGKDWSYFCALTYPRTHFYYLSPAPSSSSQSSGPINPPPNYTHIHHSHASAPFPFPRGFFATVVYRFPTAAPESVYRVIVGECKRVLRPGGYLELSAIDLDLVNMGQHARKRVRDLKWEMQNVEADVCLANASDILLRLVGRRGFEAIKRGVVGVPVSGSLRKSGGDSGLGSVATGSTTTSSTTGPTTSLGNPSSAQLTELSSNTSPTNATSGTPPDFGFSPDLSSTASSAATHNDDNMIARVGRWWYSRCYETSMLPRSENGSGTDAEKRSMFADQALLRECEERGTNFRLLICYAQKPEQAKRRTTVTTTNHDCKEKRDGEDV